MITTIYEEEFTPGKCYDICGLMNAPIFKKTIRNGTRQRLAFIFPSRIQAVIDIITYDKIEEPTFPKGQRLNFKLFSVQFLFRVLF